MQQLNIHGDANPRYQVFYEFLRKPRELQIKFEELNAFAHDMIKAQMAQYGHMSPTDQEVDGIVARIMSNEEEVRRLSEQLNTKKLLEFFKKIPQEQKQLKVLFDDVLINHYFKPFNVYFDKELAPDKKILTLTQDLWILPKKSWKFNLKVVLLTQLIIHK